MFQRAANDLQLAQPSWRLLGLGKALMLFPLTSGITRTHILKALMKNHKLMRSNHLQTLFLSIVFLAMIGSSVVSSQEHNNSSDSINDLNILFRQEYAEARNSHLSGASPVILVRGDYLVMLRGGKRANGSSVHANYHDLKAVSHGPLALFCILTNCLDKPLSADHSAKLKRLRTSLTAVANDLQVAFEDPRQRSRQEQLVHGCAKFIDTILRNRRCSSEELDELVDGVRASIALNAGEAARLRIDNYHEQMKRWRGEVSDDEWRSLYVIIPGAAMPRKNSLAVRYFAKLFEQEGEGNRVIYAESQFEESQGLKLLGTHLLDSSIGKVFFDDSSRMKRDLLGPFANAYLDALDFEQLHGPKVEPVARE